MAKCKFNIAVQGSIEAFVSQAQDIIEAARGVFDQNGTEGTFYVPTPLGRVKGTTLVSGETVTIAITGKPLFVSCGAIRRKVEERMGQAGTVTQ